jgi:hypothetical protein
MMLNGREAPATVEYRQTNGWDFPDHTVLVKSFAANTPEDSARPRRWLETRFLVRDENEWVGYSYAWNAEQTDAELVVKEGFDQEINVGAGATARKVAWHFPSRTECMVCHSRVANFVIGLSELQMNKLHDYGGIQANQIAAWEHRGLFRVKFEDQIKPELKKDLEAAGVDKDDIGEKIRKLITVTDQREPRPSPYLLHPVEKLPHLVDPYDSAQDLNLRARSYLHANCAHCHVETGGGNAQFKVDFPSTEAEMKLIDVAPLHHTFDIPDARLIAPGKPDGSVLLHRMALRGRGQMPQIATSVTDEAAVKLIREWISKMPQPK